MQELFSYPEDRSEIFEGPNEEEAHFYFTLNDIEHYINKDGAHFVLSRMGNDAFEKLSEWFYDAGSNDNQEVAWLLKKQRK